MEEEKEKIKELMELKKSLKDVSTSWLSGIIDSLNKLETHETLMFEGCESLIGYIEEMFSGTKNLDKALIKIQVKNMDLMISEFSNVFTKAQGEISEGDLKEMENKLGEIINLIEGHKPKKERVKEILQEIKKSENIEKMFDSGFNDITKTDWIKLNPLFWKVARHLRELRKLLIKKIPHLLWTREKPKSKKEKR